MTIPELLDLLKENWLIEHELSGRRDDDGVLASNLATSLVSPCRAAIEHFNNPEYQGLINELSRFKESDD